MDEPKPFIRRPRRGEPLSRPLDPLKPPSAERDMLASKISPLFREGNWSALSRILLKLECLPESSAERIYAYQVLNERLKGSLLLHSMVALKVPNSIIRKVVKLGGNIDEPVLPSDDPRLKQYEGFTPLHLAAAFRKRGVVEELLRCGAAPTKYSADGNTAASCSVLAFSAHRHEATNIQRDTILLALLRNGATLDAWPDTIPEYLKSANLRGLPLRGDFSGRNLSDTNFIDSDLTQVQLERAASLEGAWYSPGTIFPPGFDPRARGMRLGYQIDDGPNRRWCSEYELRGVVQRWMANLLDSGVKEEAENFLNSGENGSELAYSYLQAYRQAVDLRGKNADGARHLLRLAPTLMFEASSRAIEHLLAEAESNQDMASYTRGRPTGYHANEAEFMVLLNDPRDPRLTDMGRINDLTSMVTSPYQWIQLNFGEASDKRALAPPVVYQNWARMGVYTFLFKALKYDAMFFIDPQSGLSTSLLSEFAFTPAKRSTDEKTNGKNGYGSGYIFDRERYEKLYPPGSPYALSPDLDDREIYLDFRRGYICGSVQGYATELIRNSSFTFGRNLMDHPVYNSNYSIGDGYSELDLLGLDADLLRNEFSNIFDFKMNQDQTLHPRIRPVLNMMDTILNGYRAWKFDTNPATSHKTVNLFGKSEDVLVGGYLSEGSRYIPHLLRDKISRGDTPHLAFRHPRLPPWGFHSFEVNGQSFRTLEMTPERVHIFDLLARGYDIEAGLYVNSGVGPFIDAGFNKKGDLVIVSGRGSGAFEN